MIYFRRVLLPIYIVLISLISNGQELTVDKYTRFVNLSLQEGLSHNTVNDIIQDSQGFMWFATENGLSRYDGYSFQNFFHSANDTNSLPGNSVLTLAIDHNEQLWIGTTEGLCRLDLNSGTFFRYMARMGEYSSPRSNHIRKLYFSPSDSTLWVETFGGTLTEFDIVSNLWQHYSHQSTFQPYYRYHTIFEDSQKNIWVGGRGSPIIKLDRELKSLHSIYALGLGNEGKRDNDLADIIQTSKDEWFVMGLDGIYRFYPNEEKFAKIHSSSTFSVVEDNDGTIWFGSGYGLLEYNPKSTNFTAYRNNKNNPNSIAHNHINKVYIDRVGNIWAGTRAGVSLLAKKSKLVDHYFHIPGDDNSLSANEVTALAQGNDSTIYIGTAFNGLNIWRKGDKSFKQITADISNPNTLSANRISTLYFDSDQMLWIGLWAGVGFNSYKPKTGNYQRYALDFSSFSYDWYNSFLELSDKRFIAGVWGGLGAIYFDRQKGEFINQNFISVDKPYNRPIRQIVNTGNGNYFLLTYQNDKMLFGYDSLLNQYSSYSYKQNVSRRVFKFKITSSDLPFPFETIHSMDSDENDFAVIATNKGIIGWYRNQGFFELLNADLIPIRIRIANNKVYLLQENCISVFTSKGEILSNFPIQGIEVKDFLVSNDEEIYLVSNHTVFAIQKYIGISKEQHQLVRIFSLNNISKAILTQNNFWIGTQEGLFRFERTNDDNSYPSTKVFDYPVTNILDFSNSLLYAFSPLGIFSISHETYELKLMPLGKIPEGFNTTPLSASIFNDSTMWLGFESGHYLVNVNNGNIVDNNYPSSSSISSHLTSTLLEDRSGDIWIGTTNKGLNRVNRNTGKVKHFFYPDLPSNTINATIQSSDGKIWVATDKGLCYIIEDLVVRVTNIPPQIDVRSLIEDNDGQIWAGTNNGILTINPATFIVQQYNEFQGFPTSDFSKASIKLLNGYLAFGASKGFFVLDPKVIQQHYDFSTNVFFTQFGVFGEPRDFFISNSDTLELAYNENFFNINFSSADFGFVTGSKYIYKLEGIDPSWNQTNLSSVFYTNIKPGKYKFQITKLLPSGLPSEKFSTLNIWIKPAFWQTVWFKFFLVLIIVGGASGYTFIYIRQLNAAKKNVELEQRLLISQMNPHFIFNSLSAIQSFMYRNQPEEAGNYLSSFSRLVRLILENSRSELISIRQELQTLDLYLSLQKLRFPNKFEYRINVDPSLIESFYGIPPMLAQPFIENSIEHGIMHMDGNGFISVEIKLVGNLIRIIIEDNGVGIEKSKQININKRLSHTSYATSITRERVRVISSKKRKEIGIEISDLCSLGAEGTRVEIKIPANRLDKIQKGK